MQLSKIIVGQLIIIFIVVGVVIFLSDGITHYSNTMTADYNDSGLQKISDKYATLSTTLESAKSQTENVTSQNPLANFIDLFFGGGLKAAKIAIGGADIAYTTIDVAVDETARGYKITQTLKLIITSMIIVVLFIGILLYIIVGRERL